MPKVGVPVRVALVGCLLVVLAGCVGPLARDVIPVVVVGTSQAATIESAGVGSPTLTLDAAAAPDGWRPDQPIVVNAVAGSLSEVKVTAKGGGEVPGTLSEDGRHWQSSGVLLPGTTYRVTTAMTGSSPQLSATKSVKIRTMDSTPSFEARISPRDGARVGVGMPVLVRFSAPVAEEYRGECAACPDGHLDPGCRGRVELGLGHQGGVPAQGVWPARTTVAVSAALAGVQAGADMWGAQDKGVEFTIGRSVVSVVDVASPRWPCRSTARWPGRSR